MPYVPHPGKRNEQKYQNNRWTNKNKAHSRNIRRITKVLEGPSEICVRCFLHPSREFLLELTDSSYLRVFWSYYTSIRHASFVNHDSITNQSRIAYTSGARDDEKLFDTSNFGQRFRASWGAANIPVTSYLQYYCEIQLTPACSNTGPSWQRHTLYTDSCIHSAVIGYNGRRHCYCAGSALSRES